MNDRLVKALLFDGVAVASTGSVESGVIDMRWAERAEALLVEAISESGDADVSIEYAVSHDGETFGAYTDNDPIVTSSGSEFVTAEGVTAVAMPNMLAPYVKFKVTGVGSNPADTIVTIRLLLREGY